VNHSFDDRFKIKDEVIFLNQDLVKPFSNTANNIIDPMVGYGGYFAIKKWKDKGLPEEKYNKTIEKK